MPKTPLVKSANLSLLSVPLFWPMAMAMAMLEEGAELYAKNSNSLRKRSKFMTS